MEQTEGPVFGEVKAAIHEKRRFVIPVSGVEDVRTSETITISPETLSFTFQRYYTEGDPKPPWSDPYPTVRGPRRLKDGSLSPNSTHSREFFIGTNVRDKNIPAWVLDQVEKHRPPQDS